MWSHVSDVYWIYKRRREAKTELDTEHLNPASLYKSKYGEYWERGRAVWDEASYHALESSNAWPNRAGRKICHSFGEYATVVYLNIECSVFLRLKIYFKLFLMHLKYLSLFSLYLKIIYTMYLIEIIMLAFPSFSTCFHPVSLMILLGISNFTVIITTLLDELKRRVDISLICPYVSSFMTFSNVSLPPPFCYSHASPQSFCLWS